MVIAFRSVSFVAVVSAFFLLALPASAYTFYLDDFQVTVDGEVVFRDDFEDGPPPPEPGPIGGSFRLESRQGVVPALPRRSVQRRRGS